MPSKIKFTAPKYLAGACWALVGLGGLIGSGLADTHFRGSDGAWLVVAAACLIAGAVAAFGLYVVVMKSAVSDFREREKEHEKKQMVLAEAFEATKREATIAAQIAFPNCIDEETLLDPDGEYAWPKDMFARLFSVPDAVVKFEVEDGDEGEVRMWSKDLNAENSKDEDYIDHMEYMHDERKADEAARELAEMEQREQEMEEAKERARERLLAERADRQVVVSLADLQRKN